VWTWLAIAIAQVKDSSVPLEGTVPVVANRFGHGFLSSLLLSGCLLTVIPPLMLMVVHDG